MLKLAGDGVGWSDLSFLQNLCTVYPENKFMATILARENQHEACRLWHAGASSAGFLPRVDVCEVTRAWVQLTRTPGTSMTAPATAGQRFKRRKKSYVGEIGSSCLCVVPI